MELLDPRWTLFPVAVAAVIFLFAVADADVSNTHPPPSSAACTDELVAFSPCLPYVSSSPNNATALASAQCCGAFAAAVSSAGGCLCYLARQPNLLGFPLNTTRLVSLPSFCVPETNASDPSAINRTASPPLDSFCSGMAPLPPLQGTADQGFSDPNNSELSNPPNSGPAESLPPEPTDSALTPRHQMLPEKHAGASSMLQRMNSGCCTGLLFGTVFFLLPVTLYS